MNKFLVFTALFIAAQTSFAARLKCNAIAYNPNGSVLDQTSFDQKLSPNKNTQVITLATLGDVQVVAAYIYTNEKVGAVANGSVRIYGITANGSSIVGTGSTTRSANFMITNTTGNLNASCQYIAEEDDASDAPSLGFPY